ncbi:MAG: radical SAM protein [Helicobacter sp.]|nr:radical SAM protein [Helicobacter sp.]
MAINYPLQSEREKEFVLSFFDKALKEEENLYYYPKPNHYTEIDDFALFSLKKNLTPENLKIESLYRRGEIRRDLRGKLHTLLRKDKAIDEKIINKKFFYESRKLFNLSYQWKELEISQEQREYDLIDKIEEFYPYPASISISTINFCNLECKMCPQFNKELRKLVVKSNFYNTKKYLDDHIVYRAIDFAVAGNSILGFCSSGETLLDERLPKFIAYAKRNGVQFIGVITNGILLDKKGIILLDSGLNRLTISIDGATPETYKKIRGADLNKVENNVRECIEYARKLNVQGAGIEFELNCVLVNDEVIEEKEIYLQKWSDCRDIIARINFINCYIYDNGGKREKNEIFPKDISCQFPWTGLLLQADGNMSVCCEINGRVAFGTAVPLGNAKVTDLEKLWLNGAEIKRLRQESLFGLKDFKDLCEKCREKYINYRIDNSSIHSSIC